MQHEQAIQQRLKTTQQLSQEELTRLKQLWKKCADEVIHVTRPGGEFTIDSSNKAIVEGLFWWFFNDPRSCFDLHKGILIKGDIGTGKTTLIRCFRKFFTVLRQGFPFDTAVNITLEYSNQGNIDKWLQLYPVAIDEIGRENTAKHYGNELNVIQYLLHERYAIWQETGIVTIATTNLVSNELESLYGDIIRDRMREMFTHIAMPGESRRQNPNK